MILTVPPRHGKSETTSRWFPGFAVCQYPNLRVGVVSYAAEFAASWGRKVRDSVSEYGPSIWGVRVRENVAARDAWELEAWNGAGWVHTGGGMLTTGVGGPLTGRGLDLAIIDDPVKNSEEAFSPTYREKTWDWFNSTLMTRLEPGGRVILIMTRWHEDDLAGRLIESSGSGGEPWTLLNFPALAEPGDLLGRQPGEPLWPERYDAAALQHIRENRGEYWFSSMYQQRPVPLHKSVIDVSAIRSFSQDFANYYLAQPDGSRLAVPRDSCTRFCTVDLATSTKQTADYTVLSTWAQTPNGDTLLLDVVRQRFEGPDHLALLANAWATWTPGVIIVESVAYQASLIQQALRTGLPVIPYTPDRDKLQRSLPFAARVAAGRYYFPVAAAWKPDVMQELARFPAGEHDDFVDTASLSALYQAGGGFIGTFD